MGDSAELMAWVAAHPTRLERGRLVPWGYQAGLAILCLLSLVVELLFGGVGEFNNSVRLDFGPTLVWDKE